MKDQAKTSQSEDAVRFSTGEWCPAGLHMQGLYANDGSCNILARPSPDDADSDSKAVCAVFLQKKAKRGEAYRAKCAERDANIALICAAPDLYAACVEFCRKVEAGEARSTNSYAKMAAAIEKVHRLARKS